MVSLKQTHSYRNSEKFISIYETKKYLTELSGGLRRSILGGVGQSSSSLNERMLKKIKLRFKNKIKLFWSEEMFEKIN